MIKIKDFQDELLDFLDDKLINNFEICSENSISNNSSRKLYSPFLLSLIGIVLSTLTETAIRILLQKIYKKLISTPNNEGLYNFYGNSEYFYDVDTTAEVSTFIFNYSQKLPNKDNILQQILGNQSDQDGSILTWFNRSKNNVDWFVNFNVFILLKLLGCNDDKLIKYLRNNAINFYKNGSQYYDDISLSLFMISFYRDLKLISQKDFFIPQNQIKIYIKKNNLITENFKDFTSFDSVKNNKNILLDQLHENWAKDILYFNSSKAFYTATELNAAITLYLLNKMEVSKDE